MRIPNAYPCPICSLFLSFCSLLSVYQKSNRSCPAAISPFLIAIFVLFRNKKSTYFPFFVQKSFFKDRVEPNCLCISFLSSQYSLHFSNKCLGVCTTLQSLKHLPFFILPYCFREGFKKAFSYL